MAALGKESGGGVKNILIQGLLPAGKCLNLVAHHQNIQVGHLKEWIFDEGLAIHGKVFPPNTYYLTADGTCLQDDDGVETTTQNHCIILQAHHCLFGGKGGFGTLIRAMGTQINKNGRKGACRDLSGRRMRDVDAEKKMAKWVSEEPERKKKRREAKQKKLEQQRSQPKHYFNDSTYMDQIESTEKEIDSALQQGMNAAAASVDTKGKKRKISEPSSSSGTKKQKIWVGVEESSDEYSDSDCESNTVSSDCSNADVGESSGLCTVAADDADVASHVDERTVSNDGDVASHVDERIKDEATSSIEHVPRTESQDTANVDTSNSNTKSEVTDSPLKMIDVEEYGSVEEVMEAGAENLKYTLQSKGLKCGGTLRERAQRLFSIKGKSEGEIDSSLFARKTKKK